MEFYVLTLFPEMIDQGLGTSITGRAIKNNTIGLHTINIRDFSEDKHRRVDDYTYGGGAGMLMQPQPVYDCWKAAADPIPAYHKKRTIYVTPQGKPFTQKIAGELAACDDLIFLCGHYEGIDERVLEEVVTDYISIGDYVLTGGELAAMVMIDAISRLVPGVLHNEVSAETESFHGSLLEYPQYSRPEEWHGKRVPEVLLSGNQKQVDIWRLEEQKKRTKERRPDLFAEYEKLQNARKILLKDKLHCMDMISCIDLGRAEVLQLTEGGGVLIYDSIAGEYMLSDPAGEEELLANLCKAAEENSVWKMATFHEEADAKKAAGYLQSKPAVAEYKQAVLTRKEKLPVTGLYRPDGKKTKQGLTIRRSPGPADVWQIFADDQPAGSIRLSPEGRMECLYIEETFRRQHMGLALETFLCNELLTRGCTPYCQIPTVAFTDPVQSLQNRLGLYTAKQNLYRIEK